MIVHEAVIQFADFLAKLWRVHLFNDDMSRQEEKGNVGWYDVTTDNVRVVLGQ